MAARKTLTVALDLFTATFQHMACCTSENSTINFQHHHFIRYSSFFFSSSLSSIKPLYHLIRARSLGFSVNHSTGNYNDQHQRHETVLHSFVHKGCAQTKNPNTQGKCRSYTCRSYLHRHWCFYCCVLLV